MSEAIESARQLIQSRLADLDAETQRLARALQSLGEEGPAKRRGRPRRKSAKRAARGQRRQQFLTALQKSPGAKVTEIAKQLDISANQAHTLARLHKQKAIRKSGKGYRLAGKVSN